MSEGRKLGQGPGKVEEVKMTATVRIRITEGTDAITRITGPEGDEWRSHFYDLYSEDDVLEMWADNCIRNGVGDVSELDGWADLPKKAVEMYVLRADEFERD